MKGGGAIAGLAALLFGYASAGCQLAAGLETKELANAPTDASGEPQASRGAGGADAGDAGPGAASTLLPKPGCVEGRPGATTDCGGARDCCETASVTAGDFYIRTGTIDDNGPDDVSRPASLSAFSMDVFEVTVGRFRAFVEAGGGVQATIPKTFAGAHPSKPESGWRESFFTYMPRDRAELEGQLSQSRFATWSPKPEGRESHPIVGVSWYQALAFCIWDGGRLPTDAEWAYAAAGGAEQRRYPWGPELVADPAVWQCGEKYGGPFLFTQCSSVDVQAVGSRPNGRARWGHEDMLGNAEEWLLDIHCTSPPDGLCKDCVMTGSCFQRTTRGGGVTMLVDEATRAYSRWVEANSPNSLKGFRCVRNNP